MRLEDHLNKARQLAGEGKMLEALGELASAITLAAGGGPSIQVCRETIGRVMKEDLDLRQCWVSSIACIIMDFENGLYREGLPRGRPLLSASEREVLAETILDRMFKP